MGGHLIARVTARAALERVDLFEAGHRGSVGGERRLERRWTFLRTAYWRPVHQGQRANHPLRYPGGHLYLLPDRSEIVAPSHTRRDLQRLNPLASGPTSNSPGLTDELPIADQSNC
jgi:hypothetical protein